MASIRLSLRVNLENCAGIAELSPQFSLSLQQKRILSQLNILRVRLY